MSARTPAAVNPEERTLVIERVFDAPRELVFQVWTERAHALHWWAPQDCTVTLLEMDVCPGGAWRKCMRRDDGTDHWRSGVFQEVVPPERLVFTYITDDPHGRHGQETLCTVTFTDHDGQTLMSFRQTGFDTVASRDAHHGGWTSGLERLAGYLAGLGA